MAKQLLFDDRARLKLQKGVETLAQERTPEHMRGRVFGSLQAFIWLASLLGALIGGVLGQLVGLLPALDLAAVLCGLSGVVALVAVRRQPSEASADSTASR